MERARLTPTPTKISKKQGAPTSAPQPTPALTLAQHLLHLQKQMWQDYALFGGAIPKGGPPGIPDFQKPRPAGRPFHPSSGAQKDPASGFLTIPREVGLGLGQVVPRWGAIDFSVQSGDVMHFDDRYGIGKPFDEAKAPAAARVAAENKAGAEAAAKARDDAAKAAGAGAALTVQPTVAREPLPPPR
jgi:hypothetical protein